MAALTIGQAAAEIGVHTDTVHTYIKKGHLSAFRLPSGHWRVKPESLEQLKRQSSQEDADLEETARQILASVYNRSKPANVLRIAGKKKRG